MSESPFNVIVDLLEDPKSNGDYELHATGDDLHRLYRACRELEEELAKLKSEYKSSMDTVDELASKEAHQKSVMREALEWYASRLAELGVADGGERAAKALAKAKGI